MNIPFATYRKKVLGCWLGKAVGGTLGGPWEGHGGPHALTFYDPVPTEMIPNDDLDLQVVWLEALRRHGLPVDRGILARAWQDHVHFWPDEYGVACRNLTHGLQPPLSGAFDNGFTAGMGSAIRSEIWACLAPGDPQLAAAFAREDACVDHADEGVHAEVLLAVIESAAFVNDNVDELLDLGLAAIDAESRVARAICDTRAWWEETGDWKEVRTRVLASYEQQNFTDVAQNLAFTVLGWLAGKGDFGKAICTAVNCGKDADCTGATLGALLGILAPDSIGEEWLKPIGRELVLSAGIVGMHQAKTLDEFTDQTVALAQDVLEYYGSEVCLAEVPDLSEARGDLPAPRVTLTDSIELPKIVPHNEALLATEPLSVNLIYPEDVALSPGGPAEFTLNISNPGLVDVDVELGIRVPDGWCLSVVTSSFSLASGESQAIPFTVGTPDELLLRPYLNLIDFQLQVNGLRWNLNAGIPLTMPWSSWSLSDCPKEFPVPTGEVQRLEIPGHSAPLADGPSVWSIDVIMPYATTPRWIVQSTRSVKVWLNGELIKEHDGNYRVPAVHRAGPGGADVFCKRGRYTVTIAVGPGEGGYVFFGLGTASTWDWIRDAEFLPTEF